MMKSAFEKPCFQQLDGPISVSGHYQRQFVPSAVDVYDLGPDGGLRIAKNPSAGEVIGLLDRSNQEISGIDDTDRNYISPLLVLRFEIDELSLAQETPLPAGPSPPNDEWSRFWPSFDSCCNQEDNGGYDFMARLCEVDNHCHSTYSQNSMPCFTRVVECSKKSYSLHCHGKNFLIMYHSHKIGDETHEIVRIVTEGLSKNYLEKLLHRALLFVDAKPLESDSEVPGGIITPKPMPHPIAIMCAVFECLENQCGDDLRKNHERILDDESYIKLQRDPETREEKGLECGSLRFNDTSIQLGVLRQKLQHLLSSIVSLERMMGLPRGCRRSATRRDPPHTRGGASGTPEGHRDHHWWHQFREVKRRLIELRAQSEQHNVNIKNQQEQIKGNLSHVSILLAERENDWSHKAMEKLHLTSAYQAKMLAAQELIASRTKRDNTVMKVIAVLTSLFLPGAFIATLFSMPVFNWNEENPRGPHFMTYWYFTAPITGTLVIGFSVWFVKMWYDDRRQVREAQNEAGKMSILDPEKGLSGRRSHSSSES